MSDFQLMEKEINKVVRKYKHKKGWLNTRYVRSGNMKASEIRQIMRLIVDRELAFDNRLDPINEKYAICFNLEEKQIILDELEDTSKISLSYDSDVFNREKINMLSKEVSKLPNNIEEKIFVDEVLSSSRIIYEGFSKHQRGEKFENFNFVYTFDHLLEKDSQRMNDDYKKLMLIRIHTLVNMHHALKIGWEEIKNITNLSTYNELFITLFINQTIEPLILNYFLQSQEVIPKYRSESRHALNLRKLANQDIMTEHTSDIILDLYAANRAFSVYNIPSKYELISSVIKDALGKSNNPRVKKALSDWRESENRVFKLFGTMSRWFADNPETRPRL